MSDWINVAPAGELRPDRPRMVEADGVMIAVFNVNGEFHAIEDTCTHDGSPLLGSGVDAEDLIDGDQIICPRHGARFCLRTGAALTPPAYEPVRTFPVRVEGGMVQVRDDRDG